MGARRLLGFVASARDVGYTLDMRLWSHSCAAIVILTTSWLWKSAARRNTDSLSPSCDQGQEVRVEQDAGNVEHVGPLCETRRLQYHDDIDGYQTARARDM